MGSTQIEDSPDFTLWAINLAYGEGFIIALERDTITTVSEYFAMLGVDVVRRQLPISRTAFKDQINAGTRAAIKLSLPE